MPVFGEKAKTTSKNETLFRIESISYDFSEGRVRIFVRD